MYVQGRKRVKQSEFINQVALEVPSIMKQPVFFSYEISSFFQNTDKYFRSIPFDQLYGNRNFDTSLCDQYKTNADMRKTLSVSNTLLISSNIAIPCGIAAYSYMSDYFTLSNSTKEIVISEKGIAWPYDVDRYKNIDLATQWIDMESERFMNWMRPSPLSKFRKLWGRIDQDLYPGTYTVTIQINVDESVYNDTKRYILLHNNGQFSDPILTTTLPCLCVGAFLVIFGIVNLIYWSKKQKLVKKYSIY